jgi:hypothetical protein
VDVAKLALVAQQVRTVLLVELSMLIMPVGRFFIILKQTSLPELPSVANKLLRLKPLTLVSKFNHTTLTMVSLPLKSSKGTVPCLANPCHSVVLAHITKTVLPNVELALCQNLLVQISST